MKVGLSWSSWWKLVLVDQVGGKLVLVDQVGGKLVLVDQVGGKLVRSGLVK